jgi:hypothetical protein
MPVGPFHHRRNAKTPIPLTWGFLRNIVHFSDTSYRLIQSYGRSLPLIFPTRVPHCCTFSEKCRTCS